MKACILAVGSEMLTPFKVDTNSLLITERLNAIGVDVRLKAVVADDIDEIAAVVQSAIGWADVLIVTGGLGPTEDDLTREAVARVLGVSLEIDERIVEGLRDRFARRGLVMSDNNRRQAMVPRGAVVLENRNGSAPGLLLNSGRTDIVLLPGPPREMTPMLDAVIRDRLSGKSQARGLFRRTLKITGRPESEVDAVVQPIYSPWTRQDVPISTTILAALGQIELHLTASAANAEQGNRRARPSRGAAPGRAGSVGVQRRRPAARSRCRRDAEGTGHDDCRRGVVFGRSAGVKADRRAGQLGVLRARRRLLQQSGEDGAARRSRRHDSRAWRGQRARRAGDGGGGRCAVGTPTSASGSPASRARTAERRRNRSARSWSR